MFKSQNKSVNVFRFKDRIPKELTSGVIYKYQCKFCNESYYGKWVTHINVRIGDHIGISPLLKMKVKPKDGVVSDGLLLCSHSLTFENLFCQPKKIVNLYQHWKKFS